MKFFKNGLLFVLSLCVTIQSLSCFGVASSDGLGESVEAFSSVSAQSYVLMNADSGEILSQNQANQSLPMASTTKIMTCIVALENGDLQSEVTVSPKAVGVEGSSIYLTSGEKLTLAELLYGLMLESANDAAVAIAIHISDTVEDFVALMNEKASQLGLCNTHFMNPNGLQADGHYSTAKDLSVLMGYCMNNPQFAEISATKTKTISAPGGKNRFLSNHNKLLRTYEDCVAGKTGFTKSAGRCLVTCAEKDGVRLICTTLGAPNDWNDHKNLFEYGFSLYSVRCVLSQGQIQMELPLVGGVSEQIAVENREEIFVSLRNEENPVLVIELPPFVYAPVSEGDVVGEAVVKISEHREFRVPLVVKEDAPKREIRLSFWQKIWRTILSWF